VALAIQDHRYLWNEALYRAKDTTQCL